MTLHEQTLPEKIAHQLRRDILRGRLVPGQPIKERDTSSELGTSRTPLREAIRKLSEEGLLILRPSRSPIVANPSRKKIQDDLEVISVLEVLSGELACVHATENDIAQILAHHQKMAELHMKIDSIDLFEMDMFFHRAVALASYNTSLANSHKAYLERLWRVRYLSASQKRNRSRMLKQHSNIVKSLELRDPKMIKQSVQRHLKYLISDIHQVLSLQETAPK